MNKRSAENGITLVELIIAVGLFFVIIPLIWNYINGAVEDSSDINNKIIVQTSVNQLMNSLQKNVQEATLPITTDDANNIEHGNGTLVLRKPGNVVVTYSFDEENAVVSYKMVNDDGEIDSTEYRNIVGFTVEFQENDKMIKNGIKVSVVGGIDSKSNYSLTNEYYTRNTFVEPIE